MQQSDFRLAPLWGAMKHSLSGLCIAWRGERAFRQESLVLLVLVLLLALCARPFVQWLAVLGGWLGVMIVELLNSAVEKTCDLVTTEFRPLIKAAKDMASAAILLAMIVNAGLWIHVFLL